jgi:hypothetical protein
MDVMVVQQWKNDRAKVILSPHDGGRMDHSRAEGNMYYILLNSLQSYVLFTMLISSP